MRTPEEDKLREEFAKSALACLSPIAWKSADNYSSERDLMRQIAKSCYEMADAMLEARRNVTEGTN